MATAYNVSKYADTLGYGAQTFFYDPDNARRAASDATRNDGDVYYVHEVTFTPIFRAEGKLTIVTEVIPNDSQG